MKNLTAVIVFCLVLFAADICAQKNKNTVTFSSAYSNLDQDCKTIKSDDGQENASSCKGFGDYRISVSPGRAGTSFSAQTPDKKDSIELAAEDINFGYKDKKIEWRLVEGKPFAVILRVSFYERTLENSDNAKKTGEKLVVKGLKGYEYVDFEVDAKTANADAKAREMADSAYVKKMKMTVNFKL